MAAYSLTYGHVTLLCCRDGGLLIRRGVRAPLLLVPVSDILVWCDPS